MDINTQGEPRFRGARERVGDAMDSAYLASLLGPTFSGDVLADDANRQAYATDASLYYHLPQAIVRPRTTADVAAVVAAARSAGWSLTPRGAGTSLAGQAIGDGLIVDTSRFMDRVVELNADERWADVEPGVILDRLNAAAKPHGLQFGPDPSTLNRCTIGGVIGNNAWGAHAPRDGTTRDHVLGIQLLLSDGTALPCLEQTASALATMTTRTDRVGEIYCAVLAEVQAHRAEILRRFPDPARVPCNSGYALHVLARMAPFEAHGSPFNLAALVCGSEGSLGLMTQARIRLTPRPPYSVVIAAHYRDLDAALEAVAPARALGASAVELLDQVILDLTEHNLEHRKHRHWLVEQPRAVVVIEFDGSDEAGVVAMAEQVQMQLLAHGGAYAAPIVRPPRSDDVWAVRRAGLGLLMGISGTDKPVTLIEDSAVPIDQLVPFCRDVQAFMTRIGKRCVYYGSIGMGLVHLRPLLDIRRADDRALLDIILREVAGMLRHYGGALSAKHGDGRLRGPYLRAMLGDEVYGVVERIKHIFDPVGTMNPGVILTSAPVTSDLRPAVADVADRRTALAIPLQHDAPRAAAERCHGAGVCRRVEGDGAMCPSFRATRDELASTRARANVLRNMLAQRGAAGVVAAEVHAALELCLGCKACRRECPANVDMARAKVAHLHDYYQQQGVPLRARAIANLHWYARMVGVLPRLAHGAANVTLVKRVLGFHPARRLPAPAGTTFSAWLRNAASQQPSHARRVVLLNDVFTEYFDPHIGQAATRVLWAMNYHVVLAPCFPSARAALSQGLLEQACERLQLTAAWLQAHTRPDEVLLGLEPSELLTWRDEAASLGRDTAQREQFAALGRRTRLFEEWLQEDGDALLARLRCDRPRNVWVHVHCHQKALSDAALVPSLLRRVPQLTVEVVPSGCCGMAGAFGYEVEHYAVSQAVSELVLLPTLRRAEADDWIVATGTSCRQQIADGIGRTGQHIAEVLATCLP